MRHPRGKRKSDAHAWLGALWLVIPLLVLVAGGAAWWFFGDDLGFDQPTATKPPPPKRERVVKPVEPIARIPEPESFPKGDAPEEETAGFTDLHQTQEGLLTKGETLPVFNPGSAPAVPPTEPAPPLKSETYIPISPITIAPETPRDPGRWNVGKGEAPTTPSDPALRPTARLQPEIRPKEPVKAPTPVAPAAVENLPFEEELAPADTHRVKEVEQDPSNKPPPRSHSGGTIAMVIDDLGFNKPLSKAIALLPYDVTLAVLPGGGSSKEVAQLADAQGKELILHQPMQPIGYPGIKPGPGALLKGMSEAQINDILEHNFLEFPHAKGLNNHMGSLLSEDTQAMDAVMRYLKPRGMLFLDSRTSNHSVGYSRARALGIPATQRDVFIDNAPNKGAILKKLAELVTIAKQFGQAVGIGHPYQATLEALREWLPTLKGQGLEVARLSHLLSTTQVKKETKPSKQVQAKKETKQAVVKQETKQVKHSDGNKTKPAQDHKPTSDGDDAVQQEKTDPTPKVSIVAD